MVKNCIHIESVVKMSFEPEISYNHALNPRRMRLAGVSTCRIQYTIHLASGLPLGTSETC